MLNSVEGKCISSETNLDGKRQGVTDAHDSLHYLLFVKGVSDICVVYGGGFNCDSKDFFFSLLSRVVC